MGSYRRERRAFWAWLFLLALLPCRALVADASFQVTLRGQDLFEPQGRLSGRAQKTLAPLVAGLLRHRRVQVAVEGMAEDRPADPGAANRRASMGRAYLLDQGLAPSQVSLAPAAAPNGLPQAPGAKPKVLRLTLSGPDQELQALAQELAASKHPDPSGRSTRLDLGIGWPELSLRLGLSAPVDLEAKVVVADGLDVAGARFYWDYARWQRVGLNLGLEGGYVDLHGAGGWTGHGWETGAFAGAEVSLASWLGLEADLGPTHLSLQLPGQRVDQWTWVANTALYLRLF